MRVDTYEPLEDEEVREINPSEMIFCFSLSKEECHLKYTGVCSLDRKKFFKTPKGIGDANFYHCRKILKSLKQDGQDFLIDIGKQRCGHYSFNDGQHRVCIAKRKGLKLKAVITNFEDDCDICQNSKKTNIELK